MARACQAADNEKLAFWRVSTLADVAIGFARLGRHDYAERVLAEVESRLGDFADNRFAYLTMRLAVAYADLGQVDRALERIPTIYGISALEWRSDVYGEVAINSWRRGNMQAFDRYLTEVRHPYSRAVVTARVILLMYDRQVPVGSYLAMIRSAGLGVGEVLQPQQQVKLALALGSSCLRINELGCARGYFSDAERITQRIQDEDSPGKVSKAESLVLLARTYAALDQTERATRLADSIGYREWKALALPAIANNYYRRRDIDAAMRLVASAWKLTKGMSDTVYRGRLGLEASMVKEIAVMYARLGIAGRAVDLIAHLPEPADRAEAFLRSAYAAAGLWLPFSWKHADIL